MRKSIQTFLLFLIPLTHCYTQYQPEEVISDTFLTSIDIFEVLAPMDITLTFDMKAFQRNKHRDEYADVNFLYQISDSLQIEHILRIKPRGNFRKKFCSYTPFWLNIKKADFVYEHLQEFNKIKVVTQCRGGKDFSDYVLKEYLAYKIYNILSPASFRVRLVHKKYIDTGRKNEQTDSWGFLIEPEEMMAERNQGTVIKNDKLAMSLMRPGEMDLAAMFQYMIGNSDYSIAGRHNMKILALGYFGIEGYTPVPYDFDYTGLVNAKYAVPREDLDISSVRDRYFLGPCREDHQYQKAIDHINNHRDEILELVSNFPYLTEKHKNEMIKYLEDYFDIASSKNFIAFYLKNTCR